MEGLTKAANPMNVIILDACREDPFGKAKKPPQKGLSQMDAPINTILAYATSPGNVASDGEGANGLYTENLLREMQVPEAKIEDIFKRVRLNVRRKSNGAQIPWESTSLEDDFWFHPPKELKKLSDAEKERLYKEEKAVWDKAETAIEPGPVEDYLRRYPTGNFSELAQLRLDRILAKQGEKKVEIVKAADNPFTKGSAQANTQYKVGDSYTFRDLDAISRVEQTRRTLTVTQITDEEVIFSGGLTLDLLGNVRRLPDGRRFSGSQAAPLEFALGKRWTTRYNIVNEQGLPGVVTLECHIAAREKITVPAGTFNAFRIEYRGLSTGAYGMSRSENRSWRDPDNVRLAVASEERRMDSRGIPNIAVRRELVAYKEA
jgi:hypothetical protein